jgi:hypothetical protein
VSRDAPNDELAEPVERSGTHALEWLVEHDHPAVRDDGLRQAEPQARVSLERPHAPPSIVVEPKLAHGRFNAVLRVGGPNARQHREPR